jgi:p-cumate 2,3-dioxygenase alpha subunit
MPHPSGTTTPDCPDQLVLEDRDAGLFRVDRRAFVLPEVLAQERRAVFDRSWIYIGHGSELPEPGRFVSRNIAGRPLIFCRDRDGVVHALINSCRHRGAQVCREREGSARHFYCMYHGWVYGLDGALRGVPGDDAYGPGFDRAAMGLVAAPRLEQYRDFWFVSFDPEIIDLHEYLAGAREYIDLVVDQSPSGRMEIVAGTQEYSIRANWKLLVENSVDDYHLVATHATWMNYMRNSGVEMAAPHGSGLLLPTAGAGRDLGNGHLCIDNPNYRGRPVARWMSVYGEAAKPDIAAIRAELEDRLGEARAARVADTNRNLVIFPNLVINDGSSVTVRAFFPDGPEQMRVTSWALGPQEETAEQRARRLHAFLTFYGPGGFATPDDIAALESAQKGFASWREVPWSDISRGMHKPEDAQLDTDEHHIRVFWRRWQALMQAPDLPAPDMQMRGA